MLVGELNLILLRAKFVVSELSKEIYSTLDKDTNDLENEQLQISHLISCIELNFTNNAISDDVSLLAQWLKSLIAKYVTYALIKNVYYREPVGKFYDIVISSAYLAVLNAAQSGIGTTPAIIAQIAQPAQAAINFNQLLGQLAPTQDYTTGIVPGVFNSITLNAHGRAIGAEHINYLTANGPISLSGFISGTSVDNIDGTTSILTGLVNAIPYNLIQNVTPGAILGRYTNSVGNMQEIGLGSGLSFINGALTVSFPQVTAQNGITAYNGNISLGGPLVADTAIAGNGFSLALGVDGNSLHGFAAIADSVILGSNGQAVVRINGVLNLSGYLSGRNDLAATTPRNFLYTDAQGNLLSASISDLTPVTPAALAASNDGARGMIATYDTAGKFLWSAPPILFSFGNGLSNNANTITVGNTQTDDILFDGAQSAYNFSILNTLKTTLESNDIAINAINSVNINTVTISPLGAVFIPSSLVVDGILVAPTPAMGDRSKKVATTEFIGEELVTFKQIVYNQVLPSNSTVVNHKLNRYPIVQVINTATGELEQANIRYQDLNNTLISFDSPPFTWIATFN